MVFSSIPFLFFFLPLTLVGVWLAPKAWRNVSLLGASVLFYAWGSHSFVGILLGTSVVDYYLSKARRQPFVAASVVLNLGVLGYFKYAFFFLHDILGMDAPEIANVVLPLGISFFTFQRLSYTLDIYRGRAKPAESLLDYLLYVTFFAQLVAGPIVRYRDLATYLRRRSMTWDGVGQGATRFSWGLGKKVIVADSVAPIVAAVFELPTHELGSGAVALGVLAYTVQLYFDFSGYSDMAIGIGNMFGFKLPENFDRPYVSTSVTEFWRRWHITLGRWFLDYVYVPLGGNRTGHTYRNLVVVFLLAGLWHGAAWTFVVWGALHGMVLLCERRLGGQLLSGLGGRVVTTLLVMMGWLVFRAPTIDFAMSAFVALFTPASIPNSVWVAMSHQSLLALLGGCIIFFHATSSAPTRLRPTFAVGLVLPCALLLAAASSFQPFLYFNF